MAHVGPPAPRRDLVLRSQRHQRPHHRRTGAPRGPVGPDTRLRGPRAMGAVGQGRTGTARPGGPARRPPRRTRRLDGLRHRSLPGLPRDVRGPRGRRRAKPRRTPAGTHRPRHRRTGGERDFGPRPCRGQGRIPVLGPGFAAAWYGARTVRGVPGVRRCVRRGVRASGRTGGRGCRDPASDRVCPARALRGRGGAVPPPRILGGAARCRRGPLRGGDRGGARGRCAVPGRRGEAGLRARRADAGPARGRCDGRRTGHGRGSAASPHRGGGRRRRQRALLGGDLRDRGGGPGDRRGLRPTGP
ncbi:hypothetical protein STEPF1_07001 [Streptomyces sp. F-1]|nr:hypothetical protein STEPF1_07001 [Streptomyces sp. F-1]